MAVGKGKTATAGFTLIELVITIAIIGVLATISYPNFKAQQQKAEYVSMLSTLKYLMDGEDLYFYENDTFYPEKGNVNVPKGKAVEIPELAYNFPQGHKNRYRIKGQNNKTRNYYQITVDCDFDSNGDGKDDKYAATTEIRKGVAIRNREVVQLK